MRAKTSLSLEPTSFKIPFSNFKPSINKYILEEWQTSWNNSIGNKLLDIKPTIGEKQSVVRNIRKEEVVLARLRLGHTRVTHSYLLQGEEQPQCVGCDSSFTVRHFLLECGYFAQVRNNCFHVDNMKELFQDIHIDSIKTFSKVSNGAKIRNQYNQVPHLTQDTNGKVTNSQKTPQTRAKRSALSQQVTTKHI